jgi:Flp pilus assembly protein TadG
MNMRRTIEKISQRFMKVRAKITGCGTAVRDDSGAALIELAVGLTVLTTLILGAAEFGRLAYAAIEITDAAHAGAQFGSQSGTAAADTANMKLAAAQDAPNVSGMTATASYSCTCSNGTASTCAASDCASSRMLVYVTVNTSAAVDPLIYVPGLPKTYTVTGKATMLVVQ